MCEFLFALAIFFICGSWVCTSTIFSFAIRLRGLRNHLNVNVVRRLLSFQRFGIFGRWLLDYWLLNWSLLAIWELGLKWVLWVFEWLFYFLCGAGTCQKTTTVFWGGFSMIWLGSHLKITLRILAELMWSLNRLLGLLWLSFQWTRRVAKRLLGAGLWAGTAAADGLFQDANDIKVLLVEQDAFLL